MNQSFQDIEEPFNHQQQEKQAAESQHLSEETRQFLKSIQGELQLQSFDLLQISYWKIMIAFIPLIFSLVGIIFLFRSIRLRVFCLYQKAKDIGSCTHIYVKSTDGVESICRILRIDTRAMKLTLFNFEELVYQVYENEPLPLGIKLKEEISHYFCRQFLQKGLGSDKAEELRLLYGKNEHITRIPPYHEYLARSLTQPFIILQYLTSIIYLLENSIILALMLISTSIITIHINYILLRKSYKKLKSIAKSQLTVMVKRDGQFTEIDETDLLPGDLYKARGQIPCDSIVVARDLFVNEVGYTGENIPVGKFQLTSTNKLFESLHWVYEGSAVISQKEETLLLAINTGFSSRKGRILRKIQNIKHPFPQIFKDIIWLAAEIILLNVSLYGFFYHYMFDDLEFTHIIYLRLIDFIINSVPAVLHIYINLLYSFSLIRLNKNGIIGTECQKTTTASRLQTFCFDKTGTLTENTVQIAEIILITSQERLRVKPETISAHTYILRLFASCHSVQECDGVMNGDEIDLKMFTAAQARFSPSHREGVVHEIHGEGFELEVCKIHQFESQFQSMSVLVRDKMTKECFIFVKGSPQMIHSHSVEKHEGFDTLVKELSLEGLRTIAVGMRQVDGEIELARLANSQREECLRGIQLLGLTTFTNQLKVDACQIVETLRSADIEVKIITGDNIFVAVQTALALGIVQDGQIVVALEGAKLQPEGSLQAVAICSKEGVIKEAEITFPNIDDADFGGRVVAMDFDFIKRKEALFLQLDCAIYARATPQTKTLIVKKEKEKLKYRYDRGSWSQRWFGGRSRRVGMVGDGANDLMAIREADIGIGISNSDAVYSSDLTIKTLTQIDFILRESKAAERRLIQICLYTILVNSLLTILQILNTHESSNFPALNLFHRNFLLSYPITIFLSFSSPTEKLTKYCPSSNMIGLQNHLLLWGSMVINSAGIAIPCLYYSSTPYFHPNNNKTSLTTQTDTSTITYLPTVLLTSLMVIGLHHSHPWKVPIWKNIPLSLIVVANFIVITLIFLNTESVIFLGLTALDKGTAIECYLMALGAAIVNIAYCQFIRSLHLYKRQFSKNAISNHNSQTRRIELTN